MKRNMYNWIEEQISAEKKKAMPILSFPSIQLLSVSVKDLISDSDLQAEGMASIAKRTNSAASVSLMDLSLEAEAFGASVRFSDEEVPTVIGQLIEDEDGANELKVPAIGSGRTQIYIDAIEKASKLITDRPVLAGIIGPFSLAGRLLDVSEAMIMCYDDPDTVHLVLEKCTDFLIEYCKAYEKAGANGVIMAEPLAGLMSPSLCEEFSSEYIKKIVDAVQNENFIVCYHNCGDSTVRSIDNILETGCKLYHFGNAIDIVDILPKIPSDVVVMGNIDPASQFRNGTPESIKEETLSLLKKASIYKNFVISSGCDIPPLAPWENIDAFFEAVNEFYK